MESVWPWMLSNSLTALGLCLAILALPRRWRFSQVVYWCWLLVLVKLLLPPLLTVPLPKFADGWFPRHSPARNTPSAPTKAFLSISQTESPPATYALPSQSQRPIGVAQVALGIWFGGTLLSAAVALRRFRRLGRWLERAEPPPDELQQRVDAWARRMGLRYSPRVRLISGVMAPFVRPALGTAWLVIPRRLWLRLKPPEQDGILVHELAHLRRRDHQVRCFELVVTVIYWWHPLVWFVRSQLHRVEERLCDGEVQRWMPAAIDDYAHSLIEVTRFLSRGSRPLPQLASGVNPGVHLKGRIEMLMHGRTKSQAEHCFASLVLLAVATSLPLAVSRGADPPHENASSRQPADRQSLPAAKPTARVATLPTNVATDSGLEAIRVDLLIFRTTRQRWKQFARRLEKPSSATVSPECELRTASITRLHEALSDHLAGKLVARPSLITQSGRTAEVKIGGKLDVRVPSGPGQVRTEDIDLGWSVGILPQITEGGRIRSKLTFRHSEPVNQKTTRISGQNVPELSVIHVTGQWTTVPGEGIVFAMDAKSKGNDEVMVVAVEVGTTKP